MPCRLGEGLVHSNPWTQGNYIVQKSVRGLVLRTNEAPKLGLFRECEIGGGGTSGVFLMVVGPFLLLSAGPGALNHWVEPSLKKLKRSRGARSTLHGSERVAERLSGFSAQFFPAAPNGSYGNRRAAGPGPGDCSSPDPQAPMRVTCSGHRGSGP